MRNIAGRLFCFILLFVTAFSVAGKDITFSVNDFSVESANEKYLFIGKGISMLVAGELRKTGEVKILDRSILNDIFEEQKLSLTGMMDESRQLEVGKLLSADYIIYGAIVDMGDLLMISVRMADVETGELAWEDNLMGKLENYDYIGAYFADSILTDLGISVQAETSEKLAEIAEKDPDAIIALSKGIDAYDKGEEDIARKELEQVRVLDPGNEVAGFFLSKLQSLSPKFRVENQIYTPSYNPATLGFINQGRIYLWTGFPVYPPPGAEEIDNELVLGDSYVGRDDQSPLVIGVSIPVGERSGVDFGINFNGDESHVESIDDSNIFAGQRQSNWGGYASFGSAFSDWFSAGASILVYYTHPNSDLEENGIKGISVALSSGFMISGMEGNLIFDLCFTYSTQKIKYLDTDNLSVTTGSVPMIIDGSLNATLIANKLFMGLKGITDIYQDDRGGYAQRLIPMAEYWLTDFLSLRGGYEFSYYDQLGERVIGHGGIGGFTLKLGQFNINTNVTYRQKPVRQLPGYAIPNMKFLIGLEYEPDRLAR